MRYYRVMRLPEDCDDGQEVWARREDAPPREAWTCTSCLHTNNAHSRYCEECGRRQIK